MKILLADDHPMILAGIQSVFEREHDIQVVGTCGSGEAAVELVERRAPDVALLDLKMGGLSGIEAAKIITDRHPTLGVVLYTAHERVDLLRQALDSGARGYVLKGGPAAEIVRAVRRVQEGGAYVDPSLASAMLRPAADAVPTVSGREREVLELLADGLTTRQIAARLYISPETVRTHTRNAMGKLEADTRTQAVALALRGALIR